MLNPIFWKKVQGQKHPGRWGIVEHQIPSIKVLFKINAKRNKHSGIKLLSSESKTQLVNQRKQKVALNPGSSHSPEIQSYRIWWGAASPILNDTPVVCLYTSYNRTHIENAYIYIYKHRASGWEPRSSGGNTSSNPQDSALVPRPVVNGMERMCQCHGSDQTPTLLYGSIKSCVNRFIQYNICSRGCFAVNNSKLRNCVIVAIECFSCNDW